MKDLPVFTCEAGIASLILHEVPYRREAYILVRAAFGPQDTLLRECESFCRAAGAEKIYVGGEGDFSGRRIYARLLERSAPREMLNPCALTLRSAQELRSWSEAYNARFAAVPMAKTCDEAERRALAASGQALWVCDGDKPVGLGRTEDDEILCLAALERGRGAEVCRALAQRTVGTHVRVLCAEENTAAMRLYDRLGFDHGVVKSCFYFLK